MSELSLEQYQDHEFFNPDRWVDFTSKEMVLLDPANGNPYKPNEPPEWIASDPRLVRGYELLGDVGAKHKLTIAHGGHHTDKDLNLSNWYPGWYEKEVAKSGAVGFECVGWSRADYNGGPLIDAVDLAKTENAFGTENSFMRRIGQAALDNQKPLFSYDIELTGRAIEDLVADVTQEWLETRKQNKGNVSRQLAINFAGTQFLRDWYIPSNYMLVTEELRDSIGDTPKVLMTIGSAHGAVARRMNEYGLKPREISLTRAASWAATARSELNTRGRIGRSRAEALL